MSEEDFQQSTEFFGMKMSLSATMLMMLLDHIHHRGQFTIYVRIAGGRVPQIYGPSMAGAVAGRTQNEARMGFAPRLGG